MTTSTPRGRARASHEAARAHRGATQDGVQTLAELASLSVSLPVSILGSLVGGAAPVSGNNTSGVASEPQAGGRREPHLVDTRVSLLDPLIAAVRAFVRSAESLGTLSGGRAGTPGFSGPGPDETGSPAMAPGRAALAPLATSIYLVRDLARSFQRGAEGTARRLRQRR